MAITTQISKVKQVKNCGWNKPWVRYDFWHCCRLIGAVDGHLSKGVLTSDWKCSFNRFLTAWNIPKDKSLNFEVEIQLQSNSFLKSLWRNHFLSYLRTLKIKMKTQIRKTMPVSTRYRENIGTCGSESVHLLGLSSFNYHRAHLNCSEWLVSSQNCQVRKDRERGHFYSTEMFFGIWQ